MPLRLPMQVQMPPVDADASRRCLPLLPLLHADAERLALSLDRVFLERTACGPRDDLAVEGDRAAWSRATLEVLDANTDRMISFHEFRTTFGPGATGTVEHMESEFSDPCTCGPNGDGPCESLGEKPEDCDGVPNNEEDGKKQPAPEGEKKPETSAPE